MILRSYQEQGVSNIRDAFRRGRRSVGFVAPTGSGKTVIMSYIANGAKAKGNRMMIVVHRQELVRQTSKALESFGVPHSFIVANQQEWPDTPVQIAMIQTLVNRMNVIPPNLLMIDEFHHGVSESYLHVMQRYPGAKVLGLTATPQRLDGKGLGAICEELVMGPTVQELIERGFLCRPVYYAPPTDLDMKGVPRRGGDFSRGQAEERVDRPTITGSAVEHYQKICPGVPAIAFCVTIKHAEHVRDQFNAAGIPSASIDGTLDDDTREDRVAALADGRIKVLTSVDVISEGFDLPVCGAAILLRPTESLGLHLQQIGRILRPAEGKIAYVLDHVGNCMRHGLAEEDREWSLDGKTGKRKNAAAIQEVLTTCPQCNAVHVSAPACPQCGHVYPVKSRIVAEVDGSLEMLTMQAVLAERARQNKLYEVRAAETKDELKAIAKARGYKDSWVKAILAARLKKDFAAKTQSFIESSRQARLPL